MNEIDLYQNLKIAERSLKMVRSKEAKAYWKKAIKEVSEEIKKKYPDLVLGKLKIERKI